MALVQLLSNSKIMHVEFIKSVCKVVVNINLLKGVLFKSEKI